MAPAVGRCQGVVDDLRGTLALPVTVFTVPPISFVFGQIEQGNVERMVCLVSANPSLLDMRCFAGGNTCLHLAARAGQVRKP